ncbi:hypothetical protein [Sneathia sanguinegens]|uniref:hypothetical protein n=1 Tax=Sneathia sanguinegens TaxID=40543 RepID=UPI00258AEE86|nr:hypothetical protein [Sneathia sanguinegens]MDU4652144.1 hypothetical protein [Sneathia sanguinegens]
MENKFVDKTYVMKFLGVAESTAYNVIKRANKEAKEKHGFSFRPRGKTTIKDLYEFLGLDF